MLSSNLDFLTAFSAVGATLNNLGPGLGDVANNYAGLDTEVKWVLMFNMILGRLEIFTLLVLLTPAYWRR
jgi:trk system potassium uptake protein TrkH